MIESHLLHRLILVLGLAAWVAGLVFIPSGFWLAPFAYGPAKGLSGSAQLPANEARLGRLSLHRVHLAEGEISMLEIEAAPGGAFSLQIKDHATSEIVRIFRFPPRNRSADLRVALDSRDLPSTLRLSLWNRSRRKVQIDAVELRGLRSGYRWAPRLYRVSGPLLLLVVAAANRRKLLRYLRGREATDASRWPNWDGGTASLVFLLCFSVFRLAPVHQLLDAKFMTVVSHSVITTGSVALPADFASTKRARKAYTLRPVGKKTYHFFSSAPAVLNAPWVALFEMSGVSSVAPDGRYLGHNERRILRFIAAFLAAALCVVLFLTARVWLPPGAALGLTLAFAFGSQIFSTISRPFWSHAWSTLLLAAALWLLSSPRYRDRTWAYVVISTLLCWAYFCRPPLSLAIVGVTLYLLVERRRYLLRFLSTGLVWAGLFAIYSFQTYQSLVPPYFLSSHLKSGRLAGGLLLTSYPEAVVGTLISPGRGLLVYVPIVVLILFVVIRWWHWIPEKVLATTALGVCLAQWQLVSMFRNWWGGQSFGPRLMSDLIPWLFLLAALGMAALKTAGEEGRFRWSAWKATGVALVIALSVFINARGAIVQETQRGAGIWNWRYPQFMAGLIPRPDATEVPGSPGKETE